MLLIQVNTVNERGSLGDNEFTQSDLKPMSFTKPMMRHRTSSILIFDDKAPQYPGEAQMEPQASLIDLATPLMEPATGGPSV